MRIFVKQIMVRVKQICYQNLKLLSKSVVKQKVGYSCYLILMALMQIHIKHIAIFAVE